MAVANYIHVNKISPHLHFLNFVVSLHVNVQFQFYWHVRLLQVDLCDCITLEIGFNWLQFCVVFLVSAGICLAITHTAKNHSLHSPQALKISPTELSVDTLFFLANPCVFVQTSTHAKQNRFLMNGEISRECLSEVLAEGFLFCFCNLRLF